MFEQSWKSLRHFGCKYISRPTSARAYNGSNAPRISQLLSLFTPASEDQILTSRSCWLYCPCAHSGQPHTRKQTVRAPQPAHREGLRHKIHRQRSYRKPDAHGRPNQAGSQGYRRLCRRRSSELGNDLGDYDTIPTFCLIYEDNSQRHYEPRRCVACTRLRGR